MSELYLIIVSCLMTNVAIEWERLLSYCRTPSDVKLAVDKCEFYGVAIANHPSGKIRAKSLDLQTN